MRDDWRLRWISLITRLIIWRTNPKIAHLSKGIHKMWIYFMQNRHAQYNPSNNTKPINSNPSKQCARKEIHIYMYGPAPLWMFDMSNPHAFSRSIYFPWALTWYASVYARNCEYETFIHSFICVVHVFQVFTMADRSISQNIVCSGHSSLRKFAVSFCVLSVSLWDWLNSR